jgi:hypothetical protein
VSFNFLRNIYNYDIVTIGVDTRWVLSDTVEYSSYEDAGAMRYTTSYYLTSSNSKALAWPG